MRLPKSISDNLRFLTAEVGAQVANLSFWFAEPAPSVAQRILERSDYANSLKSNPINVNQYNHDFVSIVHLSNIYLFQS